MANTDGVFQISAEITPVWNQQQAQRVADDLSKQFNAVLQKKIQPIKVPAPMGAGEARNAVLGIGDAFDIVKRSAQRTAQESNSVLTRTFHNVRDTASNAAASVAKGFNVATLGLPGLVKKTGEFVGEVREGIRQQKRFNSALAAVDRSGGAIARLPEEFKVLQASVISGTSTFHRAAEEGDSFAKSLLPFLTLGTAISAQVGSIDSAINRLSRDMFNLIDVFPGAGRKGVEQFDLLNKGTVRLTRVFQDLQTEAIPFNRVIEGTFRGARAGGPERMVEGLVALRNEIQKSTGPFARLLGLFGFLDQQSVKTAASMKTFTNRALLREAPEMLTFFERLQTRIGLAFSNFVDLSGKSGPPIQKTRGAFRGLREELGELRDVLDTDAPERFMTRLMNAFRNPREVIARAAEGLKDFGRLWFGGGGKGEAIQLPLKLEFDEGAVRTQATKTAKAAAAQLSETITGQVKDKGPRLFDPDAVQSQAKSAGDDMAKFIKDKYAETVKKSGPPKLSEVGDAFTPDLTQAAETSAKNFIQRFFDRMRGRGGGGGGEAGAIKFGEFLTKPVILSGDSAAKGFLGRFIARFKDESGSIQAGFAGSIITAPLKALGSVAGAATSPLRALGQSVSGLGTSFAGWHGAILAAGAALVALAFAALQSAAKFETLGISLDSIFGKGTNALQLIQQFAAVTPFSMASAAEAVIKLSSTFDNLKPEEALAVLKEIGGAASFFDGAEDRINRVVIAITQIQARGALTADNLRQVTEALPNISQTDIIKNLAENLGLSELAAKNLLKSGLVPANEGIKAIIESANEVPGSTDALAKQSQTFNGLVSTTKDEIAQLLAIVGTPILKVASELLKGINIQLRYMADIAGTVKDSVGTAVDVFKRIPGVERALNYVSKAIGGTGDAAKAAAPDIEKTLAIFDRYGQSAEEFLAGQAEIFRKVLATRSAFEAQKRAAEGVTQAQQRYNEAIADHNAQLQQETIRLTKELSGVREQLAESDLRLLDAQAALNEALTPVAPEDLERAELSLASSKLRLRQLIEDERKATEELTTQQKDLTEQTKDLNEEEKISVDLRGLSLDQIKGRLASVRASLAAQRATKKEVEETAEVKEEQVEQAKSAEQLEIDALQASIDRREAELAIKDVEEQILGLRKQGTELDPQVIQARRDVVQAEEDRRGILEQQKTLQGELNALSETDLKWEREKKTLSQEIQTAKEAQKQADKDAALAVADTKGNQETITNLLFDQIRESPKLITILEGMNLTAAQRIDIERRLGGAIDENTARLELQRLTGFSNAQLVAEEMNQASALNQLLKLPLDSPVRKALIALLASRFTGFASGGVIERETFARIGEAGIEAVLPLTRPYQLQKVLADSRVLNPVLATLPRISLPTAGLSDQPRIPRFDLGSGSGQGGDLQAERKFHKAAAKALVDELLERGALEGGGIVINQTVDAKDPEAKAIARASARELRKELEGLNKRMRRL